MRYVHRPLALCAICFLLLPAAAAQGQASQLDPERPAALEYQLPLVQGRKNANPGDGNGPGGDRAGRGGLASLFGAGIVPVKDDAGAQDSGGRGGAEPVPGQGASGSDSGRRARGGRDTGSGAAAIKQGALGAPDEDQGSAGPRVAGIALTVLLVGGLLGLVLRRGLRQSEA